MSNTMKDTLDWAAGGVALAAFLKWLPAIAAILSIVWTGIRIYEYVKGKLNGNLRDDQLDS